MEQRSCSLVRYRHHADRGVQGHVKATDTQWTKELADTYAAAPEPAGTSSRWQPYPSRAAVPSRKFMGGPGLFAGRWKHDLFEQAQQEGKTEDGEVMEDVEAS
eukprot:jgi/Chrzof1/14857/Cz09g18190.t1